MSIITGLYPSRGLMRIAVDGRTVMSVAQRTFDAYPLQEGDAIDVEEYLDRLSAAQCKAAYEAALAMLARSAKTRAQVRKALMAKGYVEPAAEAALERLTEARLLDDRAVAERMVELSQGKPMGKHKLTQKLRMSGVSAEDIEAALENVDDEQQFDAALTTARKLARRYEGQPPREARGKLSQALMRRGFSWDTISRALDALRDLEEDE